MAFVREERDVRDDFPEWEYLYEIGVRNMFGDPLEKFATKLVVDRERNFYLIPQGHTNINRDYVEISFYALCLDGLVLNMEVKEKRSGKARECTYECHWDVEKIKFPEDWLWEKMSREKLRELIEEAFCVETYTKTLTPERVRKVTVKVSAL